VDKESVSQQYSKSVLLKNQEQQEQSARFLTYGLLKKQIFNERISIWHFVDVLEDNYLIPNPFRHYLEWVDTVEANGSQKDDIDKFLKSVRSPLQVAIDCENVLQTWLPGSNDNKFLCLYIEWDSKKLTYVDVSSEEIYVADEDHDI